MEAKYHFDRKYLDSPIPFGDLYLVQIGRLYCKEKAVIDTHIHVNWFELTIITDGVGEVVTNNVSIPVKKGDIYLSFPCDAHAIISGRENPLKYDYFSFYSDNSELQQDFENIAQQYHDADKRVFQDDRINYLIGNAIAEINSKSEKKHFEKLLTSIFNQVLIYLIRFFSNQPPEKAFSNITDADALCYQIMNYIDTHVHTIKNLNQLAEITGYNYSYLSVLFKRNTSHTISDYFNQKRLEIARVLLMENRLTISEIAEVLNYASRYSFSKAFLHKYGYSPRTYYQLQIENKISDESDR